MSTVTAPIATIADPSTAASVLSVVSAADAAHGDAIRADSRTSPLAVVGQRALIRDSVQRTALMLERVGGKPRADSKRLMMIAGVMAEALGLREEDGRIDGMERADSYYAPGELIARDMNPIRIRDQRRAVQEAINSKNIDPSAVLYDSVAIGYEGSAALHKPGMTSIPNSTYGVGAKKRQVHSIVTMTDINWEQAIYGAASAVNPVAENAESADRSLRRTLEDILVNGGGEGTDLLGLFGTNRIALAAYHSPLDYSATGTTLGQMYADLQRAVQAIQEANNDRGDTPDSALFSPRLLRLIARLSNIDDGGSMTGVELLNAILKGGLGQILGAMGISQPAISAPSLNVVPGAAGTETDRAGAVFFNRGNPDGLRRVISLAPSPVRTAETLLGTQTLWALRTGGIECPDATSAGIATFKVR